MASRPPVLRTETADRGEAASTEAFTMCLPTRLNEVIAEELRAGEMGGGYRVSASQIGPCS